MRDRREALGLTVRDMARALGVSEPYIYLLETGRKELHYGMALQMARFLRIADDRLVDWVRRHRPRSYLAALEGDAEREALERDLLRRRPDESSDPEADAMRRGPPSDAAYRPSRENAEHYLARLESHRTPRLRRSPERESGILRLPFYEAGLLPHEDVDMSSSLPIDRRLLPEDEDPNMMFAYLVDWRMARRVPDLLAQGDTAILTRDAWPLRPHAVYAVNMSGVVELARLSQVRDTLVVEDGPEMRHSGLRIALADVVELDRLSSDSRLVGRVVAAVRQFR